MLSNLSTLWALSHVRRKLTEKKDIKHPSCSAIWSHSTAMEVANWPNWENRATSSTSSANLVLNPTGIRSTERRPACGGGFGNLLTINCVIGCHLWHYADQDLIFLIILSLRYIITNSTFCSQLNTMRETRPPQPWLAQACTQSGTCSKVQSRDIINYSCRGKKSFIETCAHCNKLCFIWRYYWKRIVRRSYHSGCSHETT